jgi:hypothetical protein
MKVVNSDGRFQFIKNQIVKIDNRLPKYIKLKLQSSVTPEKYNEIVTDDEEVEDGTSSYTSDSNVMINGSRHRLRRRSSMTPSEYEETRQEGLDISLRRLIIEMKEDNTLRKYIKSKNAENFNKAFIKVLLGEDSRNYTDLQIPERRWLYENHPIATNADSSDDYNYGVTIGDSYVITNAIPTNDSNNKLGNRTTFISRIIGFFKRASESTKNAIKESKGLSVIDLFDILHVTKGHEEDLLKRLEGYYKMLDNAESNGQTALFDELAQKIFINIYESVLASHGYTKYIQFGELEELQKKCTRVLDIDYISDFGRVIPSKVCQKKKSVDELCVFDNYCILYYDPTETTSKKEAKAKRDPILFGLINHSDKLYYIDSWTDDLCDLTIETIADKLGTGAIKEIHDYTQEEDKPKNTKKTTKRKTTKTK